MDRLGGRLVADADAEWPLLAFTAFAGIDTKQRPEAHAPLALWVTGPGHLPRWAVETGCPVGRRHAPRDEPEGRRVRFSGPAFIFSIRDVDGADRDDEQHDFCC